MSNILEFDNVVRAYRQGENAIDGVSFGLGEGEILALLGRNGAGKTTLIRMAMGLLTPQRGEVRAFGLSPTRDSVAVKSRVGYVAEDQTLPPGATIAELAAFHRALFPRWDDVLERELIDRFALRPAAKIRTLSKGQAREVALLCAICHRPELLILDEPAGGLDPAARREFLEISIRLLNREGSSILFSSHHMSDVERLGGRVVLLSKGKVLLNEDLDRLREETCIALAPESSSANALSGVPGFLRARHADDGWHAVFRGDPDDVAQRLRSATGANQIRCTRAPLEELFVEMVGGPQ
jgi:ABC-2 type transport system ATP-binding protein